ncbi:MAG: protein kinase [Planctomycetota bacterium]|nr:protein kinase [Planctomycetota bacterium]
MKCPECGQAYRIALRLVGRRLMCRHCRHEWRTSSRDRNDSDSSQNNVLPGDKLPVSGSSSIVDTSWAGRKLGRYRVLSLLGKGGMGVVWRAHDATLRRDVALKILTAGDSHRKKSDRLGVNVDLFMQEARAVAKLQHPSVVSIFEVADDQDAKFLALELMDGGTLKEHVERNGPVSAGELFSMLIGPVKAMAVAHQRGIIHRDIKPNNFMFDEFGHLKIGDFGLAEVSNEKVSAKLRGKAVGSLGWVAPETVRGLPTTAASDIYCIGLIMLYALRGRPWLHADSRTKLLALHQNPPEVDLSDLDELSTEGADMVLRCLAVTESDRFESATDLAEALEACAAEAESPPEVRRKSRLPVVIVGTVLAILAGAGWGLVYLNDDWRTLIDEYGQPARLTGMAPSGFTSGAGDNDANASTSESATQSSTEIEFRPENAARPWPEVLDGSGFKFVASGRGRTYHLPTCTGGGRRIHMKNLVTYDSIDAAVKDGRRPCPYCRAASTPAPSPVETTRER